MDWTTTSGCIAKFILYGLGIFGVICIIAITVSRKFNRGVKAAVASQPKPKEGRVVLREIVEGMSGMEDSYIAEIREHGDMEIFGNTSTTSKLRLKDMRLHIYDIDGNLIMETPIQKCRAFKAMLWDALHEIDARNKPKGE